MSSTSLDDGIAENYFTQAFSQPEIDSESSRRSLRKVYPQSVPRNREDYPSAVDEDDLDAIIEVLPIRTILYSQGLLSAEDCFLNIFDDETNDFDRCHAVLCDPKESATQYFINEEDLFARLNSDSDYFNQHGGDQGRGEDIEREPLSEEDMLFGSGWDSDETVTDARLLDIHGKRVKTEAEEIADVALQDIVAAEDGAKYFDAEDLLVCGRDGWFAEDWDL